MYLVFPSRYRRRVSGGRVGALRGWRHDGRTSGPGWRVLPEARGTPDVSAFPPPGGGRLPGSGAGWSVWPSTGCSAWLSARSSSPRTTQGRWICSLGRRWPRRPCSESPQRCWSPRWDTRSATGWSASCW